MAVNPPIPKIQLFQNFTLKIHDQGPVCGQSYLKNVPWTSKVKVMTKVKTDGYIWGVFCEFKIWYSETCL